MTNSPKDEVNKATPEEVADFINGPVYDGDLAAVEKFLDKFPTAIDEKSDGSTALMFAALRDHDHVVELLLERGAALDVTGAQGWTALEIARDTRANRVIEMLEKEPEKRAAAAAAEEEQLERQRSPALLRDLPVRSQPLAVPKKRVAKCP